MQRYIRRVTTFETGYNRALHTIDAPTIQQYEHMTDRLMHGETAFTDKYPELSRDYDFDDYLGKHPELLKFLAVGVDLTQIHTVSYNVINERLAGLKPSIRDYIELRGMPLWDERDRLPLGRVIINQHGCWEHPKYLDTIKPERARYPQINMKSEEDGKVRKEMGTYWAWYKIIGPLPADKLASGKRAFWGDHRCNNKSCIYPRHLAFGRPEANDAFTARMDMMDAYERWAKKQWARPSLGYPEGLYDIVHENEVEVLSDRSVILPVHMSKREYEACVKVLTTAPHLPDGGYTTDPGYHVLFGALRRGVDFDDMTGCWNARINLNDLPPHKKTVTHACGNGQCVNFRHMDIAEDQMKYYQVQTDSYVTLPSGDIVNTNTGELLPSYWESWMLYWEWLRAYSQVDEDGSPMANKEPILSATDIGHVWVHPLTGCWENERFYPRWSSTGQQMNAYGFHRSAFGALGRSMHRYLLYKYMDYIGQPIEPDLSFDADHRCDNRRCCNPLHMQFTDKQAHNEQTRRRKYYERDEIARYIASVTKLRKLGRR